MSQLETLSMNRKNQNFLLKSLQGYLDNVENFCHDWFLISLNIVIFVLIMGYLFY